MEIRKFKPKDHYVRCVIYGDTGVGKTVFAGKAPRPLFASSENGLLSVASTLNYEPNYVEINSIDDLRELYEFCKNKPEDYDTLVIDSLTEISDIIKEDIKSKSKNGMSFKEWGEVSDQMKGIIKGFKYLPMHVIILCWEKVDMDDGVVIGRLPMLNGKSSKDLGHLTDIVGYMYIDKEGNRHITTEKSKKTVAKDRTGKLGVDASLDFNDWIKAIQDIDTGSDEVVKVVSDKKQTPAPKDQSTKGLEAITKKENASSVIKEDFQDMMNERLAGQTVNQINILKAAKSIKEDLNIKDTSPEYMLLKEVVIEITSD